MLTREAKAAAAFQRRETLVGPGHLVRLPLDLLSHLLEAVELLVADLKGMESRRVLAPKGIEG